MEAFVVCSKLCKKYTEFDTQHPDRDKLTSTWEYFIEIRSMLAHLKYCSLYNPRNTISAASLNIMSRLLASLAYQMEKFLKYVQYTHRNVQG